MKTEASATLAGVVFVSKLDSINCSTFSLSCNTAWRLPLRALLFLVVNSYGSEHEDEEEDDDDELMLNVLRCHLTY